jgi:uncharacterized integral membrane protein
LVTGRLIAWMAESPSYCVVVASGCCAWALGLVVGSKWRQVVELSWAIAAIAIVIASSGK